MEIKIPIHLKPNRVWPFDRTEMYFLYSYDASGGAIISMTVYNGNTPELIPCRASDIAQEVTKNLLQSIGRFVNVILPDNEHFDDMVRSLEPIFMEFPRFYISPTGMYQLGKVMFQVIPQEVSS